MPDIAQTLGIGNVNPNGIIITLMWVAVGIIVVSIIGAILYARYNKKKYGEFKVVIIEKDSNGNVHESYDDAGIFLDKKTCLKLMFFRRIKKGVNPNNVPYVTARDKKGRLQKTVYLLKVGVSNYKFLHMNIDGDVFKFEVGEEDVNWANQDFELVRQTIGKQSLMEKYGAWAAFAIVTILIFIMLIVLFGKIATIKDIVDVSKQISDNNLEATRILANMTNDRINAFPNINAPVVQATG